MRLLQGESNKLRSAAFTLKTNHGHLLKNTNFRDDGCKKAPQKQLKPLADRRFSVLYVRYFSKKNRDNVKKKLGIAWRISYTLNCAWQEGLRNTKSNQQRRTRKTRTQAGEITGQTTKGEGKMNKCLKLTMTVAAVALMCVSFAPQAQAYNEGDVALFLFTYLPQNPDNTLTTLSGNYQNNGSVKEQIWASSVYNEAFGQTELNVAQFLGPHGAYEPAHHYIPITISDTGFPNMVTWVKDQNYQNGARTAVSFFRVSTDGTVKMWRANGPHGTAPYGDIQGVADLVTITACAAAYNGTQINALGVVINVGGCLVVGGDPAATQPGLAAGGGGGGADLSGLEAGQAAIEAKLDNLPAGPQGPAGADGTAGTAGTAGAAGADGAVGPAGADGTDAPCKSCADVANAAVDLACKIAADATSIAELQECADIVVNTLLISTNICEPECDVSSEITAAIDTKLNP